MATGRLQFVIETDSTGAVRGIKEYASALQSVGTTAKEESEKAATAFDRLDAVIGKMRSALIGFGTAFVATRIVRGINEIVQAGVEFEAAFAGVRRVVDETSVGFAIMENSLREMAKQIPISVTELTKITEIGGQLGVPREQLMQFTELIAKIGFTSTMSSEEAATSFARFANIMHIPISQMETFASVVFRLGTKEFPATESEIMSFSLNLAGAAATLGISSDEVAALATALASTGLHADKAGSAITRTLLEMAKAVATGNADLTNFAAVADMSTNQFAQAFKENASGALLAFLNGLRTMEASGQSAIVALDALHLSNIRVEDVLLRSSNALDVFKKAMASATEESTLGGKALEEGFAKKTDTAQAALTLVGNRLHDIAISLSNEVTPAIVEFAKGMADAAEWLRDDKTLIETLIVSVTGLGVALVSLKLGSYVVEMTAVQNAIFLMTSAFEGTTSAVAALKLGLEALTGIGTVAAIGAITYGLIDWYNTSKTVTIATENQNKAQIEATANIDKAVENYRKYGIVINTIGESQRDIEQQLRDQRDNLIKAMQAEAEAAAVKEVHRQKVELLTKELQKHNAEIKKMMDNITDTTAKNLDLIEVVHKATAAHIAAEAIARTYGKQLIDMRNEAEALDKPFDKLAGDIAYLAELMKAQEEAIKHVQTARKDLTGAEQLALNATKDDADFLTATMLPALLDLAIAMRKYATEIDAVRQAHDNMGNIVRENINRLRELQPLLTSGGLLGGAIEGGPIAPPAMGGTMSPAQQAVTWESYEKRGKEVINNITGDMNKMFSDMIGHGKSFWDAFKQLGESVTTSVAKMFLDTMLHAFMDPFADKIGKFFKDFIDQTASNLGKGLADMLKGDSGAGGFVGPTLEMEAAGRKAGGQWSSGFGKGLGGSILGDVGIIGGAIGIGTLIGNWIGGLFKSADQKFREAINAWAEKEMSALSAAASAWGISGSAGITKVGPDGKTYTQMMDFGTYRAPEAYSGAPLQYNAADYTYGPVAAAMQQTTNAAQQIASASNALATSVTEAAATWPIYVNGVLTSGGTGNISPYNGTTTSIYSGNTPFGIDNRIYPTQAMMDALPHYGQDLPHYASGISYVPRTGPAIVHQGERILPEGQSDEIVSLLRELVSAVREGKNISIDGETLARNQARYQYRLTRDEVLTPTGTR